jgi:hypothetical protein
LNPAQSSAANSWTIMVVGLFLAFIGAVAGVGAYLASGQLAVFAAVLYFLSLAALFVLIVVFPNAFVATQVSGWSGHTANFGVLVPFVLVLVIGGAFHVVRLEGVALAAAFVAGLAVVGMIWAPRPEPVQTPLSHIVLALLFGAGLGWTGAVLANCRFDAAPGQTYQAMVQQKYQTHGKGRGYHLVLAPFGPVSNPGTVNVNYATWNSVPVGGSICAELHPGALGFAWWRVGC